MARFSRSRSTVAGVLWLLCALDASAQNGSSGKDACRQDAECERHYSQARSLSADGQFANALSEYHAAYGIRHVPTLLFNIARMNHRLGRLKEAANFYEAYLRQDVGTKPETRQQAKEYLAEIQSPSELATAPSQPEPPPLNTAKQQPPLQPQLISLRPPPPSNDLNSAPIPIYKQWWLWTTVGAVVLGGTIGIIVGTQVDTRPKPSQIVDLRGLL